jgi:hypothetical protein
MIEEVKAVLGYGKYAVEFVERSQKEETMVQEVKEELTVDSLLVAIEGIPFCKGTTCKIADGKIVLTLPSKTAHFGLKGAHNAALTAAIAEHGYSGYEVDFVVPEQEPARPMTCAEEKEQEKTMRKNLGGRKILKPIK